MYPNRLTFFPPFYRIFTYFIQHPLLGTFQFSFLILKTLWWHTHTHGQGSWTHVDESTFYEANWWCFLWIGSHLGGSLDWEVLRPWEKGNTNSSNKQKWENERYEILYLVVSSIFYFNPYLGEWCNLTNIFQMGWNHQLVLLMVQKSQTTTLGCMKPRQEWDIYHINWCRISEPSTVWCVFTFP